MKLKGIIAFLSIFQLSFVVTAQQILIENYSIKDGLKSDYVYAINQDDQGYLWIATDAGISKFNGRKFTEPNFHGYNNNEVINIFKDSKSRLWFIQLDGKVFYYEDSKFQYFPIKNYDPSNGFVKINEDKKGKIWIWNLEENKVHIFNVESLEKIKELILPEYEEPNKVRTAIHFDDRTRVYQRFNYSDYDENINLIAKHPLEGLAYYLGTNYNHDGIIYTIYKRDQILKSSKDEPQFQILFEDLSQITHNSCNDILYDKSGDFWLSMSHGLMKFENDSNSNYVKYLDQINCATIFEDESNILWVGTTNEGIFKLTNQPVKRIIEEDVGRFMRIEFGKEKNVVATDASYLLFYDENFKLKNKLKSLTNDYMIYDIAFSESGNFYYINNQGLFTVNETPPYSAKLYSSGFYKSLDLIDDIIWMGGGNNSYRLDLNTKIQEDFLGKRTYSTAGIHKNKALLGTTDGLFLYNDGEVSQILEKQAIDVRDIFLAEDSTYWIASNGFGIFQANDFEIIKTYDKSKGLSSDICKSICIHENNVWVGTNDGLNKINLSTNHVSILKEDNGLPSNEVNGLQVWNENIIAATNDGLAIINNNISPAKNPPKINIAQLKIMEKDTAVLDAFQLDKKERNIKIGFEGISFINAKEIEYSYKMDGVDENWVFTKNQLAQYPKLLPGDYSFAVKAKGLNSEWSDEKRIDFHIPAYYYETNIFKVAILIGFGMLIFFAIRSYYVYVQKKENTKTELIKSQLTALRAQMNPHFIFNSLNSLSDYILQKEHRAANKHLSNFAKLMRMILNNSSKEYVSLAEEISSLELYLSLEKVRFNDDLETKILIDEKLVSDKIGIPSLLIQPYVENALLHGLKPKENEKELTISFKDCGPRYLKVFIEDNGIGRMRSAEINNSNNVHESKGLSISSQRLELINENQNKNHQLKIHDLFDENKNPLGTKIELTLDYLNLSDYDKNGNSR